MTAHELARRLLAGPDLPVVGDYSEATYEVDSAEMSPETTWYVKDGKMRGGSAVQLTGKGATW